MAKWCGKSQALLLTFCGLLVATWTTPSEGIDVTLELPGGTLYSETDGFIEACVVLSEKPSGATTVNVSFLIILLGSADDTDISFGNILQEIQVLTFSANTDTVMCLNITITDDEETEQVETFQITIFTTSAGTSVLPPSSVTISIQDKNFAMATLAFEESNYIATEAGPVEVCVVVLERLSQRAVEFKLEASSDTATIGLDFIQSVEPIIIPAGVQRKCVFIPIINDTEIEGSENFTVIIDTIEQVNGSTVVTIKNTNGATIDIVSSDVEVMEVDSGATSSVSVCVELNDTDDGLLRDVVLLLNTVDETATGSVDYEPLVDQSLVIAFNEPIGASVCLDVTITGDNFVEGNETFVVTFTPHPTLNPEDIITGQSQVTVTIVDNPEDDVCKPLTDPQNGNVSFSGTTEGSVANYSCFIGYELEGNTQRTCGSNGIWNGSDPNCLVVVCSVLEPPTNGALTGNSTFGSVVTYSCDIGYILSGDANRTCQADGSWTGSDPLCNIVNCNVLEPPTNGTLTGNSSFGSVVTYSCDAGYFLSGDANRTCQADESWTGSDPACIIEPVVLETSRGDDLNLIAIIVGVGVGVLLVITVIIIIIIIACARSRRKKKSRKFGLDVHGDASAGAVVVRDIEDTEPFVYPTTATTSTFDIPSPTVPNIPFPPEEPADTPIKVPLNIPDLVDDSDEDDEDFIPYFDKPSGAPQKSYYLREFDTEESDKELDD